MVHERRKNQARTYMYKKYEKYGKYGKHDKYKYGNKYTSPLACGRTRARL